jgi:hypothetical protein
MLTFLKNPKDALLKRRMITFRGITLASVDWYKTDTFDIGAKLNFGKLPMAMVAVRFPFLIGFIKVMERTVQPSCGGGAS